MFDDPELLALMTECEVGEDELKMPGERLATGEQIQYIKDLIELTNGDEDDYDFDTLTISEASEVIDELKDETVFMRRSF
jgi:hypothetical protein